MWAGGQVRAPHESPPRSPSFLAKAGGVGEHKRDCFISLVRPNSQLEPQPIVTIIGARFLLKSTAVGVCARAMVCGAVLTADAVCRQWLRLQCLCLCRADLLVRRGAAVPVPAAEEPAPREAAIRALPGTQGEHSLKLALDLRACNAVLTFKDEDDMQKHTTQICLDTQVAGRQVSVTFILYETAILKTSRVEQSIFNVL